MACKHSKFLADAQVAGLSDNELDVLAYKLQQDPDAEESDEEDTLHNNTSLDLDLDLDLDDDAQNLSKTPYKRSALSPGKRKQKSTNLYKMKLMSASEVKKKLLKQCESVSCRIELLCIKPWNTVKAQFLNKITNVLSPPQIHFEHYKFSFKIP
jgi:hypothetical protein